MPYTIEALLAYYTPHDEEQASYDEILSALRTQERPFDRKSLPGHITGSAFIVSPDGQKLLMTHHKKLNKWMQLGGHSDEDSDTLRVAHREGYEESGMAPEALSLVYPGIIALDVHPIPAHGDMGAHRHMDIGFLFQAATEEYSVSDESHDLLWVPLENMGDYTQEAYILRAIDFIQSL